MNFLLFRISLLLFFVISAAIWGDWKNWQKYYPTILFVMVINLAASFLTYHHILWQYNPGALVATHTTVEMINAFALLPAATLTFLSRLPLRRGFFYQCGYIVLWVAMFSGWEFLAHYLVGSLTYKHGWSWYASIFFDIGMFSVIRIHYSRPLWGWAGTLIMMLIIFFVFDFLSGEFK
jgi:hypothetical protein